MGESLKLIRVIESKYKSIIEVNARRRQRKKEAMLENVGQVQATLAGGAALAAGLRQILVSAVLGIGSSVLGYENISGTAADWLLKFKSEIIELNYVSWVTSSYFLSIQ